MYVHDICSKDKACLLTMGTHCILKKWNYSLYNLQPNRSGLYKNKSIPWRFLDPFSRNIGTVDMTQ